MNTSYYACQSAFSDPKDHRLYFDDLPFDIRSLCKIIQGVMLHYLDAKHLGYTIPTERMMELESRHISKIMDIAIQLDDRPLDKPREIDKKVIGCCRDFSLLLCSILRHKNIPARLRFGFSTFQIPGFHHDQVLLEVWDKKNHCWRWVDARVNALFIQQYAVTYPSHDVAKNAFLTAADAWRQCRSTSKSAEKFGTGLINRITGWWYLRNKLIQDFAALNKMEMLLWDCWGMMLNNASNHFLSDARRMNLLDFIAELVSSSSVDSQTINQIYLAEEDLLVAKKIYSDSHLNEGKWVEW